MNDAPDIERLTARDAAALVALRAEALASEPLAFTASPADDVGLDVAFVERALADDGQAVFGCRAADGALVGMVGVMRERKRKLCHVARLWGLYVAPPARGRGVGAALVVAAIAHARAWDGVERVQLGVSATATAAQALYRRAGFVAWGCEPDAMRADGWTVDELHMTLRLRAAAAARVVRAAREDDVDRMIDIARRAFLTAFAPRAPFALIAWWAQADREPPRYRQHWSAMQVLEEDGVVVGLVHVAEAEINGLWVHPERHGTGVGTQLLAAGEAAIARAGHAAAWLTCSAMNVRALAFYRARGYRAIGRERYRNDGGFDVEDVRMERALGR